MSINYALAECSVQIRRLQPGQIDAGYLLQDRCIADKIIPLDHIKRTVVIS